MAQAKSQNIRDDFTDNNYKFTAINSASKDGTRLIWSCRDNNNAVTNELHISLVHSGLIEDANDFSTLQYRFDKEPPSILTGLLARKNGTPFRYSEVPTFTQKALSSSQIIIRATPARGLIDIVDLLNSPSPTYKFNLAGLREELLKLPCVDSLQSLR